MYGLNTAPGTLPAASFDGMGLPSFCRGGSCIYQRHHITQVLAYNKQVISTYVMQIDLLKDVALTLMLPMANLVVTK